MTLAPSPMRRSALTWRGLPAVQLSTAHLSVVVSLTGAQLACIRRQGETLNPLWQPPWTTAEHPLLNVIVGSNPCIDRFGPPWPGENKPLHGEAGVLTWQSSQEGEVALFRADLPLARLAVERAFSCTGDTLELTTSIRSLDQVERTIEWCEHTTLGDPFLTAATITAGIGTPQPMPGEAPSLTSGPITASAVLAMPVPTSAPRGDIYSAPVENGWYCAQAHGRELFVTWDPADFPWLCLWTQHRTRQETPWLGNTRARGMELSTKPFPEGRPPHERAQSWLGRSTTCIIPAQGWRSKTIRMRWR